MNTFMYFDAELQTAAIQAKRLERAMLAEQVRLARGNRDSRLAMTARALRAAIGALFISAGERIRPEPITLPELELDPVDRVRHA